MDRFAEAYRRYCWPTAGSGDCGWPRSCCWPARVRVHDGSPTPGTWDAGARLAEAGTALIATPWRCGRPHRPGSEAAATAWWEELVDAGGRGHGGEAGRHPGARPPAGLAQPGLKVRGPEYLRIIYGPDYTAPPSTSSGCAAAPSG